MVFAWTLSVKIERKKEDKSNTIPTKNEEIERDADLAQESSS